MLTRRISVSFVFVGKGGGVGFLKIRCRGLELGLRAS